MKCPNCQTEISELKKNFSANDFIGTVLAYGILAFVIVFIGTNIKVYSPRFAPPHPLIEPSIALILGIGIVVLGIIVWFVLYFSKKPDRCPLCDAKIKFDEETKSFIVK